MVDSGADGNKHVYPILLDTKLKVPIMITVPHRMIHEGKSFIVSQRFESLADNGLAWLRILVGANKELHATISVSAQGLGRFKISEGTTYTDNGTAVTIFDKNRTTANTSDALAYHTPTVDTFGPILNESIFQGGTKQRAIGSVRTNGEEWIFKKSTDYIIRFQNIGGADMSVSIEIEFYEV